MFEFLRPDIQNMVQVLITVPILYTVVVAAIRFTGNRSTSSMNNFDWIITVAIGSVFASTVVLNRTNFLEGAFAIVLLLLLQYLITLAIQRSKAVKKVLKASPQLLLFEGEFLNDVMREQRIVRGEVYAAVRDKGYKSVKSIYAVVLETNAKMSIIPMSKGDDYEGFSLSDVDGLPEGLREDLEQRGEEDDMSSKEEEEKRTQFAD
ncbi:DUF421 domain-containing protein [Lewinella sp. 4G2]|uniref:DUF421 domain-containing protein n=1 Tax=Lewinella sp. 4G2 TaxID=1803372 RepID=UPI0007B461A0|nr:YetF domain-containing protein [Lewinella sp. 4G2]OAV44700.1 hypothetical protein A3850_009445 [Lewinella sp. 4G2]